MKCKILSCLLCVTLLLSSTPLVCYAENESNNIETYSSCIEEYDELYFLENIYMEEIYYEHYYSNNNDFQRLDLSNNSFAQLFRTEIENLYSKQQYGTITITLEHSTELDFQEYVDVVMNTYIEFIKYYQYQEKTIQPDFSSCSFKPYINKIKNSTHEYCTDIVINYISYE